jgi:putative MATE family efflux protein
MKDMTKGPVGGHVLQLAAFIALTMLFQTLYFLADLYFVGRLGKEAIAGVGLAGNLSFLVLALTQSLGVGATSLISQSLGRKDKDHAELLFNQALVMSSATGLAVSLVLFAARRSYAYQLAADPLTARLGVDYLNFFVLALGLQFPLVAMSAALRGMGDMKMPTAIQVATVVLNIVLAPTLMFGWLGVRPLGVAGAAIATLGAVGVGCLAFTAYFRRDASPFRFRPDQWAPQPRLWWSMLRVGVPAGGEFALMTVNLVLIYSIIKPFGAAAQAGFGIGIRLVQALFLPTVAIAFAAAPVVGQNFGAKLGERVRQTFYTAATISAAVMIVVMLTCRFVPEPMIRFFNADPAVVGVGADYLRIASWNFLASGVVFVSSSIFQGMGNTLPPLFSSSLRLVLFALPAYLLSLQAGFELKNVWYLSVASVVVQLCVNLWLLQQEFDRKLAGLEVRPAEPLAVQT